MRAGFFSRQQIMKIIYTNNDNYLVNGTPAAVTEDGVILINTDLYFRLTPFQREFVKWHEIGHYRLQTHSEFEVDEYAFQKMAGKYYQSLKKMIGTLETVLDEATDPMVPERIEALYKLCLKYDAERGNRQAARELERLVNGGGVMRENGEKSTANQVAKTTSDGINDAMMAMASVYASARNADSKANTNNDIMMYLFIGVILLALLK